MVWQDWQRPVGFIKNVTASHCPFYIPVLHSKSQVNLDYSSCTGKVWWNNILSALPTLGDVIVHAVLPGRGCSSQEDTSHRFGPAPRRHPVETHTDDVRKLSRTVHSTGHFCVFTWMKGKAWQQEMFKHATSKILLTANQDLQHLEGYCDWAAKTDCWNLL